MRPQPVRHRPRGAAVSAVCYIGAWLVGLVIAPAPPDALASPDAVYRWSVEHSRPAAIQSLFVHGAAGAALACWARSTAAFLGAPRRAVRLGLAAGLIAAALSLIQMVLQIWLSQQIAGMSADRADAVFDTINGIDSVKLIALALFVGAYSVAICRGGRARRAFTGLAIATSGVLIPAASAFRSQSGALVALLYVSLPLLLLWIAAATRQLDRASR